MGGGIAQVVAASGRSVSLHDEAPGAVERAVEAMEKSLTKLAEKGEIAPSEVLQRVTSADDLVAADLMIEAVVEDARVKEAIFRRADEVLPPEAILASNTSSIPITSLAAVTNRPENVIGMHFFNPVPVLGLSRSSAPCRPPTRRPRRSSPWRRISARPLPRRTTSPVSSRTGS
jgi:3-hydroxybutyryl-CoA dehydrogenase